MTLARDEEPLWMWVAIAVYTGAVFAADAASPALLSVWVLYVPAVVICKLLTWRPLAPVALAALTSGLLVLGYWLRSSGGVPVGAFIEPLNRGLGVTVLLALGLTGHYLVIRRLRLRTVDWLKVGQSGVSQSLRGDQPLKVLVGNVVSFLGQFIGAHVGAVYVANERGAFALRAGFARPLENEHREFELGEGLVGQVAANDKPMLVRDVPDGYVEIRSGLGAAHPRALLLVPTRAEGVVNGVIEFGFLSPPGVAARELLESLSEIVGFGIRSALYRAQQADLLEESQRQGEELQAQQEELQSANEALEEHTRRLRTSQDELAETNARLEEQAQELESQKKELLTSQRLLRQKASDVERASRYKSEFLANMSHELRTPLNSALILAMLLADNKEGNLKPEQVKYAQSIYASGNDLLTLINDILDLAKIEAGKMELLIEPVSIERLFEDLQRRFQHVAEEKNLSLRFELEAGIPETIESDPHRLQQILTNLLSNAIKFTEHGVVRASASSLDGTGIAFVIEDTGIGIPAEQHEVIFEAFRQADATTIRRHGGSGLGLSICRELVSLLGGTVELVSSAPGRGSTFRVVLPLESKAVATGPAERELLPRASTVLPSARAPLVADDRDERRDPHRVLLIIEDDAAFAEILRDLGRELNFQCVVARDGSEGLSLARQYKPIAVLLDIGLPDQSGLTVLEMLKRDPSTRHVPIHVVSVHDYERIARELGAVGYLLKPVKREQLVEALRGIEERLARTVRRVLVIEDDPLQRGAIMDLLKADNVSVVAAATAQEGLAQLRSGTFDCCVLDLTLPVVDGLELLEQVSRDAKASFPPVIVYTARQLTPEEERKLRRLSSSIIVKGARSPERLLEEVTLFLHQVEAELPPERQRMLMAARGRETIFDGRRVLLVEDDVRNVFALTQALEPKGLSVEIARNGKEALARIAEPQPVDVVLMDIMMPEMDGLVAMREIRRDPRFASLPIIALTARAMPDDRLAALEAGANDYIAKPVDLEKLLSLLRVWIPR